MTENVHKQKTWARFAVTIEAEYPSTTYAMLMSQLPMAGHFRMTAIGYVETQIRLVVEYTARGANGDDVKKRLVNLGIDRRLIGVTKAASFNVDAKFNDDLVRYVGLAALEVPAEEVTA